MTSRPDWSAWRPASCLPRCFHEADRGGLVRQPANAASSLAFALLGVLLLRHVRPAPAAVAGSSRPRLRDLPGWAALFAVSLVVIGVGSALFHASLTFVGQTADVAGMYLLATFTIVFARLHAPRGAVRRAVMLYVALNAGLLVGLLVVPAARRWLFALLLAVGFALEWSRTRSAREHTGNLARSVAVLGAAFGVWVLDVFAWPLPAQHWLQGHAIWHLLGAVAAWGLWRHYDAPARAAPQRGATA
ncbi:MAG: ceramidase [Gemmatimonadaceae bacterium]|nr:ceramidase [Gemmatimonadaceae bacterium]